MITYVVDRVEAIGEPAGRSSTGIVDSIRKEVGLWRTGQEVIVADIGGGVSEGVQCSRVSNYALPGENY